MATFADVTKYMRERMNATVETEEKEDTLLVSLAHSLDKKWYKTPLTLKTYISADWDSVKIKQGEEEQDVQVLNDDEGRYILYQALPNAEPVELSRI